MSACSTAARASCSWRKAAAARGRCGRSDGENLLSLLSPPAKGKAETVLDMHMAEQLQVLEDETLAEERRRQDVIETIWGNV